jgi:hypothetical protein
VNEETMSSSVMEGNKETETRSSNRELKCCKLILIYCVFEANEPSVVDVHDVAPGQSSSNSVPKIDPDDSMHGDPGDETILQSSLEGGCRSDSEDMTYFARPVQVHHCDTFNFPSISDCACDLDGLGGRTADLEAHFNNDQDFKPFHYSDFTD